MSTRSLPVLLIVAGLAAVLVGTGLLRGPAEHSLEIDATSSSGPPAAASTTSAGTAGETPAPTPSPAASSGEVDLMAIGRAGAADLPTGIDPARITVPAIGVDAPIIDLGYASESEIEVPSTAHEAGWFTPSRRPGEIGPSIIAGHVDLNKGPAVFYRLRDLRPGDEITVADVAGETRTFVVDRLGQYPKTGLPDDVFGFGEAVPELRLITCGGVFNRATGHYEDNIVVYARLQDA